jgi:hypothetical protein
MTNICTVCNHGEVERNWSSDESHQMYCNNKNCGTIWYPVVLDLNGDTQQILKQTSKALRAIEKYQKSL